MRILLLYAMLFAGAAHAQVYPYNEGFDQQTSNQVPAGWGGHVKVLLDHGINDTKGLGANMNSLNVNDTAVSPVIGPLTVHSTLLFFYRITDQYLFPFTPTTLGPGDVFGTEISTDGVNYTPVLQIDSSNHHTNLNFVQKKIFLGQYAGNTVHVRFTYGFGGNGGGYYVDVDSVLLRDDLQAGVNEQGGISFSVIPNPCNAATGCYITLPDAGQHQLAVFDNTGALVYTTTASQRAALPVSNLATGLYFIKVAGLHKTAIQKLIVE
jgi:hypothetical protein